MLSIAISFPISLGTPGVPQWGHSKWKGFFIKSSPQLGHLSIDLTVLTVTGTSSQQVPTAFISIFPGGLKGRHGPARPSAEAGVCVPVHTSGSRFCFGEWVGDR